MTHRALQPRVLGATTYATLMLWSVLVTPVFAWQPRVLGVESRVDKSSTTVGELIYYTVIVRHTMDVTVMMPPPGINLGGFEIRDYRNAEPVRENHFIKRTAEYIIAAYDTGTFVIPPTGVLYFGADSVQKILLTDSITVRVNSLLPDSAQDILDIKGPAELARSWKNIILYSAIAAVLIVLGAAAYLYYRKKKLGKTLFERKKEPEMPAHLEAYRALERLKNSSLLAENKIKEYYSELSEIIRRYLERRYFKPILEMTTTEALAVLQEQAVSEEVLKNCEELLSTSDLVKFAKLVPGMETHQYCFDAAYKIVTLTKLETYAPQPRGVSRPCREVLGVSVPAAVEQSIAENETQTEKNTDNIR